jgi:small nuclear ribonucleoprotein (snRNP)-like protein
MVYLLRKEKIMASFKRFLNNQVTIEISGNSTVEGILIEVGNDLLVVFNGENFLYIPLMHIQNLCESDYEESYGAVPSLQELEHEKEELSLRKVLTAAKGIFVEINLSNNRSFHGYITTIMNNYFVFYSPIYKVMYISLQHLKWLIPYLTEKTPYLLNNNLLPVNPSNIPLARTLDVQLNKLIGELVVINGGERNEYIGKLSSIDSHFIELTTTRGESKLVGLRHLKSIFIPLK